MVVIEDEMRQQFLSLYAYTFPQKKQVHLTTCISMRAGWESDLFSLHLDYKEDGRQKNEEVILKMYHGQSGVQKAKREFYGLKQLACSDYSVPRVLFAVLDNSTSSRASVVMEKISGCTLSQTLDASSEEQQQKLMTQFCHIYMF